MRKILMVSYHFPPGATVGGLRPLKFAKYLPEFGWAPYVLTVKEKYYNVLDWSRMRDVMFPEQVYRTGVWPDPGTIYLKLKESAYRLTSRRHIYEEKVKTYHRCGQTHPEGIVTRLRRIVLSLLAIAGGELGWLPPATFKALLLIARYKINCVYTTSPHHTAHLVGLVIKRLCGVRWVAEFRDPWIRNPIRAGFATSKLSEKIEAWMEGQVVKFADKVICVTERMSDGFINSYPAVEKTKFMTIPHGYDPEDFSGLPQRTQNGRFVMSFIGTFYSTFYMGSWVESFLKAVRELIVEARLSYDDLEIRFIGHCHYIDGKPLPTILEQEGLAAVTRVIDPLPYRDALRAMVASDLLLVFSPPGDNQMPCKTIEYLASGADIIVFTSSQGVTADLIRRTGRGFVVEPDSIQQIKDAVEASFRKHRIGTCNAPDASLQHSELLKYHRRTLTRELAWALE